MKNICVFMLFLALMMVSCKKDNFIPKPRGYYRITLPEKSYHHIKLNVPFNFEVPDYAVEEFDQEDDLNKNWINVQFPQNNATLFLSFEDFSQLDADSARKSLYMYYDESRELAYKHTVKASAIDEDIIIDSRNRVFGTIYKIQGDAASPMQFYTTDSTDYLLRGALYFNEQPNYDSILPVLDFISEDVYHILETLKWK